MLLPLTWLQNATAMMTVMLQMLMVQIALRGTKC